MIVKKIFLAAMLCGYGCAGFSASQEEHLLGSSIHQQEVDLYASREPIYSDIISRVLSTVESMKTSEGYSYEAKKNATILFHSVVAKIKTLEQTKGDITRELLELDRDTAQETAEVLAQWKAVENFVISAEKPTEQKDPLVNSFVRTFFNIEDIGPEFRAWGLEIGWFWPWGDFYTAGFGFGVQKNRFGKRELMRQSYKILGRSGVGFSFGPTIGVYTSSRPQYRPPEFGKTDTYKDESSIKTFLGMIWQTAKYQPYDAGTSRKSVGVGAVVLGDVSWLGKFRPTETRFGKERGPSITWALEHLGLGAPQRS